MKFSQDLINLFAINACIQSVWVNDDASVWHTSEKEGFTEVTRLEVTGTNDILQPVFGHEDTSLQEEFISPENTEAAEDFLQAEEDLAEEILPGLDSEDILNNEEFNVTETPFVPEVTETAKTKK